MNQNKEQEKETNLSNPTQENRILFKVYKDEGGLRKQFNHGRWTQEEHETFLRSINRNGIKNWKLVSLRILNVAGKRNQDTLKLPNPFPLSEVFKTYML